MKDLTKKMTVAGPARGMEDVVRALGKEVAGKGAGSVLTGLRKGEWGDSWLVRELVRKYIQVLVLDLGNGVPLGEVKGYKWKSRDLGGRPGWEMVKRKAGEQGPGDWTLPRPVWDPVWKRWTGWRPKTYVRVEVMRELPLEILNKVQVLVKPDEVPHWWKNKRLAKYLNFSLEETREEEIISDYTGEVYQCCICGKAVLVPDSVGKDGELRYTVPGKRLVEEAEDRESFLVEVSGWPLKYIPLEYLRWLVGEIGWKDKNGFYHKKRTPGEIPVDGGWFQIAGKDTFQPCEGVLYRKILEFLDLKENREEFEPFKEDTETREFYTTGCWVRGEVPVEPSWSPGGMIRIEGKEVPCRVWGQDRIQKFLDLGVPKRDKWGHTGLRKSLVREHGWVEDEDPAPEDWELRGARKFQEPPPWTDHSRWFQEDWKPDGLFMAAGGKTSEYRTWKEMVKAVAWCEKEAARWEKWAWWRKRLSRRDRWGLMKEGLEVRIRFRAIVGRMQEEWEPRLQTEKELEWLGNSLRRLAEALKAWDRGEEPPGGNEVLVSPEELKEREKWEAQHEELVSRRRGGSGLSAERALELSLRVAEKQRDCYERRKRTRSVVIDGREEKCLVLT